MRVLRSVGLGWVRMRRWSVYSSGLIERQEVETQRKTKFESSRVNNNNRHFDSDLAFNHIVGGWDIFRGDVYLVLITVSGN